MFSTGTVFRFSPSPWCNTCSWLGIRGQFTEKSFDTSWYKYLGEKRSHCAVSPGIHHHIQTLPCQKAWQLTYLNTAAISLTLANLVFRSTNSKPKDRFLKLIIKWGHNWLECILSTSVSMNWSESWFSVEGCYPTPPKQPDQILYSSLMADHDRRCPFYGRWQFSNDP